MINKVKLILIALIAASSIALPAAALAQSAYTTGTAASRLAKGMEVAHARLRPCGAQIASVNNGLRPCAKAWGHHAISHINLGGSTPLPI